MSRRRSGVVALPSWVRQHLPHQNTSGELRFWSLQGDEMRGRGRSMLGVRTVYYVVIGYSVVAYVQVRTAMKTMMKVEGAA